MLFSRLFITTCEFLTIFLQLFPYLRLEGEASLYVKKVTEVKPRGRLARFLEGGLLHVVADDVFRYRIVNINKRLCTYPLCSDLAFTGLHCIVFSV